MTENLPDDRVILRIYIAGPYTADPVRCTAEAIKWGNEVLDAGHAPFVPHLAHYWHTLHTERHYQDWMQLDLAWLVTANGVLRIPGESPGADCEVELAEKYGIPVSDNLDELLKLILLKELES